MSACLPRSPSASSTASTRRSALIRTPPTVLSRAPHSLAAWRSLWAPAHQSPLRPLPAARGAMAAAAALSGPKTEQLGPGEPWQLLGTPSVELRLEFTLPTGQSFRWVKTGADEFTGVVGQRVVRLRQLDGDVAYRVLARGAGAAPGEDAAALRDYFNLGTSLASLAAGWAAADPRFAHVHPHFQGARMLRQDPVECLFQFICSSNNHISRIHGMVERLCARYGTPLHTAADAGGGWGSSGDIAGGSSRGSVAAAAAAGEEELKQEEAAVAPALGAAAPAACDSSPAGLGPAALALAEPAVAKEAAAAGGGMEGAEGACEAGVQHFAFPTLEQLAEATEEALRADGFGYRAKFITGSVALLLQKPGGGAGWLRGLRGVPYEEAVAELSALPGIGPKVAACVCLFSLDKHEAIPVDTHVWALATRYYTPHLRGKSLTKKVHAEVQAAFVDRFGPYAGWAHNTLFISELASMKDRLPPSTSAGPARKKRAGRPAAAAAAESDSDSDSGAAGATSEEEEEEAAPAPSGSRGDVQQAAGGRNGQATRGEAAAEAGPQRGKRRKAGSAAAGAEQALGSWRRRKARSSAGNAPNQS